MSTSVASAKELLDFVNLDAIEVYELRAQGIHREDPESFEERHAIKAALSIEPELLRTRFTLTFNARSAQYTVDLAACYSVQEGVEIAQEVGIEFVERVGIMAAFPFLREQLYGLASRLGEPIPVLGLVKQGEFRLKPDQPSGEESALAEPAQS